MSNANKPGKFFNDLHYPVSYVTFDNELRACHGPRHGGKQRRIGGSARAQAGTQTIPPGGNCLTALYMAGLYDERPHDERPHDEPRGAASSPLSAPRKNPRHQQSIAATQLASQWREAAFLKPFKLSNDLHFIEKLEDVLGFI